MRSHTLQALVALMVSSMVVAACGSAPEADTSPGGGSTATPAASQETASEHADFIIPTLNASDGPSLYSLRSVERIDGVLEVRLAAHLEMIEVLGRPPKLLVDGEEHSEGRMQYETDGSLVLTFEDAPASLEGAAVVLPAAFAPVPDVEPELVTGETIVGPHGSEFRITGDRNIGGGELKIEYAPTVSTTVSVSEVVVKGSDAEVKTGDVGVGYDGQGWAFTGGSVRLPIEAREMFVSGGELYITGFRWMVRYVVPLE